MIMMIATLDNRTHNSKISSMYGSKIDMILYSLLFIFIEIVFLKPSLDVICGPILAFLFLYLYLIKKDKILPALFITIANDALGTIFLGKIAFTTFIPLFLLYEIVINPKVKLRSVFLFFVALVMCFTVYLIGDTSIKEFIITFSSVILMVILFNNTDNDLFMNSFGVAVSIIVGLIALHAVITGGVIFDEAAQNVYQRRGILGIGIGDPNFSSLVLCTGLACALNNTVFNRIVKVVISSIIVAAMFITLSTAGLIGLVIVIFSSSIINRNITGSMKRFVCTLSLALIIVSSYYVLPESYHIADLDAYIVRMVDKYNAFLAGDFYSATTGRSYISEMYWNYINEGQSWIKMFFGWNSVFQLGVVAHNTYVTWIMIYGYLGMLCLVIYCLKRLWNAYFSDKNNERKLIMTLKLMYIVFIASISIFTSSTFVLMFLVLFIF